MPSLEEDWLQISNAFNLKWNFPHCIGAIDGKHVQIEAPTNSGSTYFNYHGTFSIVMMVIADADYRIIYSDVGCQGSISDGGVFRSASFYEKLTKNKLKLPKPTILSQNYTAKIPYVLVADDAFTLSENIMKPFPGAHPSTVFRIFRTPIPLQLKKVESVVLACISLHNFHRRDTLSRQTYTPAGTVDSEDLETGIITPGSWRLVNEESLLQLQRRAKTPSFDAKIIRQNFGQFFLSTKGKVPSQDNVA